MSQTASRKTHRTIFTFLMVLLLISLTAVLLITVWRNNQHLLQTLVNRAIQPYGFSIVQMDNLTISKSGLIIKHLELTHPASGLRADLKNLILALRLDANRRLTASLDPFDVRWSGRISANEPENELLIDDLRGFMPASSVTCDAQYNCRASIAGHGYVTIGTLNYDGIELSRASAHWQSPLLFTYTAADGIGVDQLQTHSQFEISKLQTATLTANLADFQFQQSLSIDDQNLRAELSTSTHERQILTAGVTQNLHTGDGHGQFTLNALGFDSAFTLRHLLPSLPENIDIVDGQLLADASLSWQIRDSQITGIHGPLTLMAQSLSGYVDDVIFTRLGWHAPLTLRPDGILESGDTLSLALAELDVGIRLTDISTRARFDADSQTLELDRPTIGIFGGTISADSIRWHPEQRSELELQLRNINVAEILSLTAYQSVSATGILNGELPVQLTGTQATITGGRINAAPPGGTISYRQSSPGAGNANTDLVFRALQRYNYDTMEMQVDLLSSGELILTTALQGSSPMLNDGQKINLNLNITDNIPALLSSLQAGRSVTDMLERRLNE